MSDWSSDEEVEQQQAPPQQSQGDKDAAYWRGEAEKAFKARDSARQELRTQIQAGYDPEVVELVPKDLAPEEWKSYADKLVTFRGKAEPVAPETSTEEPAQEEQGIPEPEKLAGIVGGPSGSASGTSGTVDRETWAKLTSSDPQEAERLFKAGKVDLSGLREGLGPDR